MVATEWFEYKRKLFIPWEQVIKQFQSHEIKKKEEVDTCKKRTWQL